MNFRTLISALHGIAVGTIVSGLFAEMGWVVIVGSFSLVVAMIGEFYWNRIRPQRHAQESTQ